jgi:hypothetical protein
MRNFILIAAALLLAGCATRAPEQAAENAPSPAATPAPPVHGGLLGLSAGQLIQRLGPAALQIREGASLKMQFRGRACILDAFLYPTPQGERVTHVDTRLSTGANADQATCIASLSRG